MVIIDGSKLPVEYEEGLNLKTTDKIILFEWPEEFDWKFIGGQFQRGYDACTGSWIIRADCDYFFHEDDFEEIRQYLEKCDAPVATMPKRQFLLADRSRVKSRVPIAFNKGKYGNRIKLNAGGDLCQPSLDGKELKPDDLPEISRRELVMVSEGVTDKQLVKRLPGYDKRKGYTFVQKRGITFWNFDFCWKTKDVVEKDYGRFARAWHKTFGNWALGGKGKTLEESNKSAFDSFMTMMTGRFNNNTWQMTSLQDYPKYIREKVKNIKPEQFGYSMFGEVKR